MMPGATDEVKFPLPGGPPPGSAGAPSKAEWRAWARALAARADLASVGAALQGGLAAWLADLAPTTVVGYAALGAEVTLEPLVDGPRGSRHSWALTRTPATGEGMLTIHPWHSPRERHRFGFSQPVAEAPIVPIRGVGVVLVPGLAFDRHGVRLGHGGGYYDRLLATLPSTAQRLGVTPALFVVERLPADPHDIAMTHIATEHGVSAI